LRQKLATEIVRDTDAPVGVRLRVALAEGVDASPLGETVTALFAGTGELAAITDSQVNQLAGALEESGSPEATKLRVAVANPGWFMASSPSAAAIAVLSGARLPSHQRITVDELPTAVIDDLVDVGAPIAVSTTGRYVDAHGRRAPLRTYVAARTRPPDLSNDELGLLGFEVEAYRRFVFGDDAAAVAISEAKIVDARVARSLRRGETPVDEPHDAALKAAAGLLRSGGGLAEPELLADRSLWRVMIGAGVSITSSSEPDIESFLDLAALHQARAAIFEWDWGKALAIARERLRGARREAVRDELLNIMACALWQLGQAEAALAALDKALEGEYTDALLTNAAVIASELDHDSAIDRFVKIAREAPGSHQRAMAAERALLLWANDEARIWDDEDERIPMEILGALRLLIGDALPAERYLRIIRALSAHDAAWLASQPKSAFGPHADTAPVRVFTARARGIEDFAAALARELRRGAVEPWVEEERDSVVDAAISVLAERNDELGPAFFGMTLIQAGIPLNPRQKVLLVSLTVTSITQNIDPGEGEPKEEFIDWVGDARAQLRALEPEHRAFAESLVVIAGEALARTYVEARRPQLFQASNMVEQLAARIRGIPAWQLNRDALRDATRPVAELCDDSWRILHRVRPLVVDRNLLVGLDAVARFATELNQMVRGMW